MAAAIVVPLRLMPGANAAACARPMRKDWRNDIADRGARCSDHCGTSISLPGQQQGRHRPEKKAAAGGRMVEPPQGILEQQSVTAAGNRPQDDKPTRRR